MLGVIIEKITWEPTDVKTGKINIDEQRESSYMLP